MHGHETLHQHPAISVTGIIYQLPELMSVRKIIGPRPDTRHHWGKA